MTKINKILVADDHELILNSICAILTKKRNINKECIDTFTSSEQVLNAIKHSSYDLYILDLEFQKLSGFELIESIRQKDFDAKILICTMHQEVWNVNRLLESDINGIVLKNSANIYLEQAIDAMTKGEYFLCPKFKEVKYKSQTGKNKIKNNNLTNREKEILQLVVAGNSSKDVANQLGISENTVEKHRKNIFLKLDVSSVAELVRIAIHHRLVEFDL